jgi:hypothetical protein
MSDHGSVSDLVFRDLAPEEDGALFPEHDEAWLKQLREELGKLRSLRSGPRVVPASSAAQERLEQPAN